MDRKEIVTELFKKSIIPIAVAALLFIISRSIFTRNGVTDYFYVWIICGLPFGYGKLRTWISVKGGDLGVSAAIFVLNFVLAGLIGGFILIWKLIIAVYYIPVSIIRLMQNSPRVES